MKIRKVIIAIVAIGVVGILAFQCKDWRLGRVLVRMSWYGTGGVRWSKDGKSLYYLEEGHEPGENDIFLHKYNVITGERADYRSAYVYAPYDISAGDDVVIYADEKGLKKIRLGESKASSILSWPYSIGQKEIRDAIWLSHNRILFSSRGEHIGVYLMDVESKLLEKIPIRKMDVVALGQDGNGFLFDDGKDHVYYYDLATKKAKPINSNIPDLNDVVYLSRRQVIYLSFDSREHAYALNLETGTVTEVSLPEIRQDMGFSPDCTKYWLKEVGKGEWNLPQLYVFTTPQKALQQLRLNLHPKQVD